jgi:hypothetical protein
MRRDDSVIAPVPGVRPGKPDRRESDHGDDRYFRGMPARELKQRGHDSDQQQCSPERSQTQALQSAEMLRDVVEFLFAATRIG